MFLIYTLYVYDCEDSQTGKLCRGELTTSTQLNLTKTKDLKLPVV